MKIGLVSRVVFPIYGFGGMEKHVYQLAKGLAEKGVDLELFCMESSEKIPDELIHPKLNFRFIPHRKSSLGKISYTSFVANLIPYTNKLNEKDIVHFQGIFSGVPHAFLGKTPKVYTPHGLEQFKHFSKYLLWPFNLTEILAIRKASKVISLGPGNTKDIISFLKINQSLLKEIPNGVNTDFFEPKDADEYEEKYDLEGTTVIGLSRLVKHKGFDLLIKAVNALSDEMDINLILVGDGPDRNRLERIAQDTPTILAGRVKEEELPHYYSLGDIFCLPTHGEGMRLSILESFACGTPVISTRTSSIPDLVDENVGKLIEPGSQNEIEKGLKNLLNKNIKKLSENCRERAVEKYSWNKTVEKTLNLYEEILNPS